MFGPTSVPLQAATFVRDRKTGRIRLVGETPNVGSALRGVSLDLVYSPASRILLRNCHPSGRRMNVRVSSIQMRPGDLLLI